MITVLSTSLLCLQCFEAAGLASMTCHLQKTFMQPSQCFFKEYYPGSHLSSKALKSEINKLAPYKTDSQLFTTDVSAKFKVT